MQRAVATVICVLGLAGPVRADVELGGVTGVRVFSEDNGLGVEDHPEADSQKNTALFGIRLGAVFGRRYGGELELGVLPGEGRSMLYDVWNVTVRASFVFHPRTYRADRLVPFVLVGGGAHSIVSSSNEDAIGTGTAAVPHAGFGVKYRIGNGFGLRFDGRVLLPPSSADDGFTTDLELLATVYRDFGWKKPPPKQLEPPPPPPPVDEDPDQDGLAGAADRCANDAEDPDGFQDDDGCPELDNDDDGVIDASDRCPEPEDRDGFGDDDGCPELDNDDDGVADAADKCAVEPETRNGYLDGDGCPDELPAKLRVLTSAPLEVAFRPGSAELAPGPSKSLDYAVTALAEFGDVVIEIGVHTDDQPPPRGSKLADNQALSQARAEAVKSYLVSQGIVESRIVPRGYGDAAPVEDPQGLTGPKLNAARAKNRRVELKLVVPQAVAAPPALIPDPTQSDPAPAQPPAGPPPAPGT